jgi:hypothetical protein
VDLLAAARSRPPEEAKRIRRQVERDLAGKPANQSQA